MVILWKMHSQYENTLNFTGKTVKMVNVQEGQQYIIAHHHATNSFTTWLKRTGQDVASQCTIPQVPDVHRCTQMLSEDYR